MRGCETEQPVNTPAHKDLPLNSCAHLAEAGGHTQTCLLGSKGGSLSLGIGTPLLNATGLAAASQPIDVLA